MVRNGPATRRRHPEQEGFRPMQLNIKNNGQFNTGQLQWPVGPSSHLHGCCSCASSISKWFACTTKQIIPPNTITVRENLLFLSNNCYFCRRTIENGYANVSSIQRAKISWNCYAQDTTWRLWLYTILSTTLRSKTPQNVTVTSWTKTNNLF